MRLGEILRRFGFYCLDYLQGRPVMKKYKEIEYYFNHKEEVPLFQQNKFYDLAIYAKTHSDFYKNLLLPDDFSLQDFPIIDKNIIKENKKLFLTEMALKKNSVEMHTSGSTGTPMVVIQDKDKRDRVYAEMMYLWGIPGYSIGMRYMFLRKWNRINRKNTFTAHARNLVMTDVTLLDNNTFEGIRQHLLRDNSIKMIIGYASILDALAQYLFEKNDDPMCFGVKTILSGSEVLSEKTRNMLRKVFGEKCNVVSLYSNQENGMLAIECNEHKEFHLNTASYIFEILKLDSDDPVDEGELGRVVITDLFNYAMPIIRYDTGDLAIRKEKADCSLDTEVVASIEGRKVDVVYNTLGTPISPHTITNALWKFDQLKQFQLIQLTRDSYQFIVNDPADTYCNDELVATCKEILGEDAKIGVKKVDKIPVLASGKFKYIICNLEEKTDVK